MDQSLTDAVTDGVAQDLASGSDAIAPAQASAPRPAAGTALGRIDPRTVPGALLVVDVLEVRHWNEHLFSFRVNRPDSLRFRSGEFLMVGIVGDGGRPLMRAYSIASAFWDESLEFYSIKVPDGPLTSRLQHVAVGDQLLIKPKPVGTLVLDALSPAPRLWMVATGTGIAPFASLLRDPDVYARFERVVLTHTCRARGDLAYGHHLVRALAEDPLVGEEAAAKLLHYPTTTREPSARQGRITDLIRSSRVFDELGLAPWSVANDRVMICGSLAMNRETATLCEAAGLGHGSESRPGGYVTEKAFVG